MERISVIEAGRQFDELVRRVAREQVTVELEQDNEVIARLSPVGHRVRVADLNYTAHIIGAGCAQLNGCKQRAVGSAGDRRVLGVATAGGLPRRAVDGTQRLAWSASFQS
jgi:hypothetical protein